MRPLQGVLLDTHIALWTLYGSQRVGARLRRVLDSETPLFFSAASSAEIALKTQRGLLATPPNLRETLADLGVRELPFDADSADAMARFPGLIHHDPFDHMLVAQAAANRLSFETADRRLLALGLPHIKDARA
jgi:PIN domain nuclease of toxin-antitoxin system